MLIDQPILELRDLNVAFTTPQGPVYALQDVSFKIDTGKIVGVVGESGSGKSTVVWSICRLLSANGDITSGELLFNGEDILGYDQTRLEAFRGDQVSIVFQDPMTSQNPVLSYAQQMIDIQYRSSETRAEKIRHAIDAMQRVGIPDPAQRIHAYPHHFSGGMRQRAGIAMALMMNPSLLIADEATTALDVTMEAQIIHLIQELKREIKGSVMVVSHNLGMIAELCDEVIVMYAGRVIEAGSVQQIFHDPRHPYTQALIECDPARVLERSRNLPTIPGDVPRLGQRHMGCGFAPRCTRRLPVCDTELPRRVDAANQHRVHCHLYSDNAAGHDEAWVQQTVPGDASEEAAAATTSPRDVSRARQTLLQADRVNVRYRTGIGLIKSLRSTERTHVDAVIDASLHIHHGETLGLVGESGSGKTSLGRALLRLNPSAHGRVVFDGTDISEYSVTQMKPLRRHVAMMFQDPVGSLSPRKTVRALLCEPFQIHGIKGADMHRRVAQLFDVVGLPNDFAGRYPHELSGGQARRVGVARALALNPKLVVADEPTAGLDVSVQGEILNLMASLQREHGLSYLIISHNLPVIRHVCDRVAIMYMGRIVEQGDCDQIFSAPAHPYTQALINAIPKPDPDKRRELVSIAGEVPSLNDRPSGCEFHPRCAYQQPRCRTDVPASQASHDERELRCHYPLQSLS